MSKWNLSKHTLSLGIEQLRYLFKHKAMVLYLDDLLK